MLTFCSRSGAPTIEPTVCRGLSDEYGSWKIIPMSRRSGRIWPADRWLMSRPSNRICPPVGSSSRVSSRPVVVLPQPDSPTTPSVCPAATEKLTSSTACTAPIFCRMMTPLVTGKCLVSPVTSSSAPPAPPAPPVTPAVPALLTGVLTVPPGSIRAADASVSSRSSSVRNFRR